MEKFQHYVCGFLFNPTWERVLLIRKNRPEWQAGKLNGIGGKIEPNETPLSAMIREFKEESGLDVSYWTMFDSKKGFDWEVHFFCSRSAFFDEAISMTDEKIEAHSAIDLPDDVIPNLKELIPLASVTAQLREIANDPNMTIRT